MEANSVSLACPVLGADLVKKIGDPYLPCSFDFEGFLVQLRRGL
jgi:hypothetical protein